MAKGFVAPNADLWGLNPQTGRLYSTRERRDMLHDRGIRGNIGGPLPSMMWDDYNDRFQNAISGLPEDFNAGNYSPQSLASINKALMVNASNREADFEPGPIMGGMPNAPDTSMGAFKGNAHVRPSVQALQRSRKHNVAQRPANFYPNAGK